MNVSHSRVAISVHAAGVGSISTSTQRTNKPKLSDWSLWERGDIPGGIVLETTSLCLRTREVPSSASCRRPTCRAIRADISASPRPTASNGEGREWIFGSIEGDLRGGRRPAVGQTASPPSARVSAKSRRFRRFRRRRLNRRVDPQPTFVSSSGRL